MFYGFDLNEAIDVYDYFCHMHECSVVIIKVLINLIRQSFSAWNCKNEVTYVPKFTKNR